MKTHSHLGLTISCTLIGILLLIAGWVRLGRTCGTPPPTVLTVDQSFGGSSQPTTLSVMTNSSDTGIALLLQSANTSTGITDSPSGDTWVNYIPYNSSMMAGWVDLNPTVGTHTLTPSFTAGGTFWIAKGASIHGSPINSVIPLPFTPLTNVSSSPCSMATGNNGTTASPNALVLAASYVYPFNTTLQSVTDTGSPTNMVMALPRITNTSLYKASMDAAAISATTGTTGMTFSYPANVQCIGGGLMFQAFSSTPPSLVTESMPGGATTINPLACNSVIDSAHLTANFGYLSSANTTAGSTGSIWIPAGCKVYLNSGDGNAYPIQLGNKLICAGDGIAGLYNQVGYTASGGHPMLDTVMQNNVEIAGCTFIGLYNPASGGFYNNLNTAITNPAPDDGNPAELFNDGHNDILESFYGSGTNFTNNWVQGQLGGLGVLFYQVTSPQFTNNVVLDNALTNAFQTGNSPSMTITGNYFRNSSFANLEQSTSPRLNTSGTVSSNTFVCTTNMIDSQANITTAPIYPSFMAGFCTGGYVFPYGCQIVANCDGGVSCSSSILSGLSVTGNTFIGLWNVAWLSSAGFNDPGGNTYVNGAQDVCAS